MQNPPSQRTIPSPIGTLRLWAGTHLQRIEFASEPTPNHNQQPPETSDAVLDIVESQLGEFFSGARREFHLPYAPNGTEFQKRVWRAMAAIPFGETRSYGDIARDIGQPTAARAVGMAANRNPIPIILPCHRIVGRGGELTGYAGGVERKSWLLKLECPNS